MHERQYRATASVFPFFFPLVEANLITITMAWRKSWSCGRSTLQTKNQLLYLPLIKFTTAIVLILLGDNVKGKKECNVGARHKQSKLWNTGAAGARTLQAAGPAADLTQGGGKQPRSKASATRNISSSGAEIWRTKILDAQLQEMILSFGAFFLILPPNSRAKGTTESLFWSIVENSCDNHMAEGFFIFGRVKRDWETPDGHITWNTLFLRILREWLIFLLAMPSWVTFITTKSRNDPIKSLV